MQTSKKLSDLITAIIALPIISILSTYIIVIGYITVGIWFYDVSYGADQWIDIFSYFYFVSLLILTFICIRPDNLFSCAVGIRNRKGRAIFAAIAGLYSIVWFLLVMVLAVICFFTFIVLFPFWIARLFGFVEMHQGLIVLIFCLWVYIAAYVVQFFWFITLTFHRFVVPCYIFNGTTKRKNSLKDMYEFLFGSSPRI